MKLLKSLFTLCVFLDAAYYLYSGNFKVYIFTLFLLVMLHWLLRFIFKIPTYKEADINQINQMEGHQFEHYIAYLYTNLGYDTYVTQASGDYGADVIAEKNGKRYAIQCKRYKNPVGIKAVQEIIGSLKMYQAQHGIVVTNSSYTNAAVELAKANNIELIDKQKLITLISQAHIT